jgi:hypothetical protein
LKEIVRGVGKAGWSDLEHTLISEVTAMMEDYNAELERQNGAADERAEGHAAPRDHREIEPYPAFSFQTFLVSALLPVKF